MQGSKSGQGKGGGGALQRVTGSQMGGSKMAGSKRGTQSTRRSIMGGKGARSTGQGTGKGTKQGHGGKEGAGLGLPIVYDDNGIDVTPKPLHSLKPTVCGPKGAGGVDKTPGDITPTSESNESADKTSQSGSFSIRGMSVTGSESGSITPTSQSASTAASSPRGEPEEASAVKAATKAPATKLFEEPPEVPVSEEELDRNVYITLKETDTFWLLNIPSECVGIESAEAQAVEAANTRYAQILKQREGSEMFTNIGTQTLDSLRKNKEAQTMKKDSKSSDCQVTVWDIADALREEDTNDVDDLMGEKKMTKKDITAVDLAATATAPDGPSTLATQTVAPTTAAPSMNTSLATTNQPAAAPGAAAAAPGAAGAADPAAAAAAPAVPGTAEAAATPAPPEPLADLSAFDALPGALTIMERAVTQNIYHDRMLQYRDFRPRPEAPPEPPEPAEGEPPPTQAGAGADATAVGGKAMHHLWDFTCELTQGRNVSCMATNGLRKDILAVGYGQFEFSEQKDGLVAFWSLKNPFHPDWYFHSNTGVTSMAFSTQQPSLLAVGFYDGMVAIYDVRAPTDKPTLESGHTSGKHSDPVWKLQWVERSAEAGGESLISISTDGRVTQWSIKKGLEHQDLMKLKRVHRRTIPNEALRQHDQNGYAPLNNKTEAFISRRSSGMCFDFCPKDSNTYVVGTEDGNIHKCSCSYSEQYLESYFGHSGPLYQIQWSPFAHNLFLSASADWTVKLWAAENENPIMTFQSGNDEVADLQWSPTNSTVIGTVSSGGRLEVWDLSVSTLKPILVHQHEEGLKLSCILFSQADPVVLCGGDNGAVSVFRLVGVENPEFSRQEELQRLEDAMSSNIISTSSEKDK